MRKGAQDSGDFGKYVEAAPRRRTEAALPRGSARSDVTLTLECNNACGFCPRTRLADVRVGTRDLDRVLRSVRRRGRGIVLSGGEATLLPGFFDTVARCRELGFDRIGLVTNGRRCSAPSFAKRLLGSGIRDLMVSVYSHLPSVHDRMTGSPGSCRESWRGLANLTVLNRGRRRPASIRVNLLVTAENVRSLAGTLRRLARLGVTGVLIMDVLAERGEDIPPYTAIRDACRSFDRTPELRGMDIRFRGYPLCVFQDLRLRGGGARPAAATPFRRRPRTGPLRGGARPAAATPFRRRPRTGPLRGGARVSWEAMDVDTTLGSSARELDKYLKGLRKLFVKGLPACGRCRSRRDCQGVQRSYLETHGNIGLTR